VQISDGTLEKYTPDHCRCGYLDDWVTGLIFLLLASTYFSSSPNHFSLYSSMNWNVLAFHPESFLFWVLEPFRAL